ncbi:MAG: MFS transporter [Clostridia bacterium]|nr:MFS transporter [Clostridia bacterium]
MIDKAKAFLSDLRVYWNLPMPGRYMAFKEIAAYAGGGIGAYFLIFMGKQLVVTTSNMIVGGAIGVSPTHMYVLYIIATLANLPLTAIRANMIDNTRNKAGKYRPYLLSMGIPTALIALGYVYFPYDSLYNWFPMQLFGYDGGYVVKCAVVLIFNLLLLFFYNFFHDAYNNLVYVLSPNTQERTDVLAVKSLVYSLAPSIANIILPLIAKNVTNNNLYDLRVYRIGYPIFSIIGIGLTIIVLGYTKEKIVQPKSRVIQIGFVDSLKAVAKNKYFWIIALAGWLGFLESSYSNILSFTYSYGHACEGGTMSAINTIIGNASMWGMMLAPFCVRAFGKKKVLIGINLMNIVCILAMGVNTTNIIWLAICVYLNQFFGSFQQITSPAIEADIRDYHHYKTGERVDGMFATVTTIGNIVTLATSSVVPFVYESYGIYEGNGYASPYEILDVTTGQPGLLEKVVGTLIIMAAVGATLNVIPYFFYDLKEVQQKSIVRILKIRAMFEDYGNGICNDKELVDTIDIIRRARECEGLEKKILTKADKKADKKAYKAARMQNEEIEISKMVLEELDKFSTPLYLAKADAYASIYAKGLRGLYDADMNELAKELAEARTMPKNTAEEKELRSFAIEIAQSKMASRKAVNKYYKDFDEFVEPQFIVLDAIYDEEESCDAKLKELYSAQAKAKKEKDSVLIKSFTDEIKIYEKKKKELAKAEKAEIDKHVQFSRAAKPYLEAKKFISAKENYKHLEELEAKYEESKAKAEAEMLAKLDEQKRLDAEKEAQKKEKLAKKTSSKK